MEHLRRVILFVVRLPGGERQLDQLLIILVRVVSLHYMHAHVIAIFTRQLRVERFY